MLLLKLFGTEKLPKNGPELYTESVDADYTCENCDCDITTDDYDSYFTERIDGGVFCCRSCAEEYFGERNN